MNDDTEDRGDHSSSDYKRIEKHSIGNNQQAWHKKKVEKVLQSKIKMKSFGILLGLIATIHITSSVPVEPEENKGMRITT